MRKFLRISIISTLFWSCTKSYDLDLDGGDIDVAAPIAISVDSAGLTRGSVVESQKDMASCGVYCAYTAQENWTTSTKFEKMDNAQFVYNDQTAAWDFKPQNSEEHPKWGCADLTDKYTFYGYSPHSTVESGITPKIINGVLQIAYKVPASYDLQRDLLIANPRKDICPQANGMVNLSFIHALSKLSFSVKGDPNRKVTSIKLKDIQNSGTLSFDADGNFLWKNDSATDDFIVSEGGGLEDDVTTSNEVSQNITSNDGYLFMLPQDVGEKSVELIVADADGSNSEVVSFTIPKDQVWIAGKSYNYQVEVEKGKEPSFHEIYPDVANCYIINPETPGEIIIPINEYISYFWSNYGTGDEMEYANVKIGDLIAETLWYDSSSKPIDAINITDANGGRTTKDDPNVSYPDFTASTSTMVIRVKIDWNIEGNAVIGVRRRDQTDYLWSWHLWITDYDPYSEKSGKTYTIDSDTKGTMLTWMDRNLGARDVNFNADSEGVIFYQWGRKDPIPAKISTPVIEDRSSAATIVDVVKEPTKFYLCSESSDYDWCGTGSGWEQDRSYHWRDNKLPTIDINNSNYNQDKIYGDKKSIFDPSPLGFMIPGSLSSNSYVSPLEYMHNSDTWSDSDANKGRTYNGDAETPIFFPASYMRSGINGLLSECYVGQVCNCWSASPKSTWSGNSSQFEKDRVWSVFHNERGCGLSVRSIKE